MIGAGLGHAKSGNAMLSEERGGPAERMPGQSLPLLLPVAAGAGGGCVLSYSRSRNTYGSLSSISAAPYDNGRKPGTHSASTRVSLPSGHHAGADVSKIT